MRMMDTAGVAAWIRGQFDYVGEHLRHVGPRTAATGNLTALIGIAFVISVWQPSFRMSRTGEPARPLAPAPLAVKMIDAAPRAAECREQTWPYIDRRCLNYGEAQPEVIKPALPSLPQPETSGHSQAAAPDLRVVPQQAPAMQATPQHERAVPTAPVTSTDDVRIAEEPEEFAPTEEELRAQARAEARQRRKARHRGHHFWIGPFRF
jgi:hypothetical protein